MDIKIKCWGDHKPKRGSDGAAGIDLYNNGDDQVIWDSYGEGGVRRSESAVTIETKTAMEIPEGYVGLVYVRSGLGFKGLNLINSCGVIDSDYRGEIKLRFTLTCPDKTSESDYFLRLGNGERVAQIVIVPYADLELNFVDELSDTSRGDGGFGSTGSQ